MIYAFFPLIAAAFYGLGYLFLERSFKFINIPTYFLISGGLWALSGLFLSFLKREDLSMAFLSHKPGILTVVFSIALLNIGGIIGTYGIKNTSASYAAFAEISYPLFTIVFAFLLFGVRHFDWSLLVGGFLILIGSFVLVYGRAALDKP